MKKLLGAFVLVAIALAGNSQSLNCTALKNVIAKASGEWKSYVREHNAGDMFAEVNLESPITGEVLKYQSGSDEVAVRMRVLKEGFNTLVSNIRTCLSGFSEKNKVVDVYYFRSADQACEVRVFYHQMIGSLTLSIVSLKEEAQKAVNAKSWDKITDTPREVTNNNTSGSGDRDGDGVADKDDACPDHKGSSSNKGCPAKENEITKGPSPESATISQVEEMLKAYLRGADTHFESIRVSSDTWKSTKPFYDFKDAYISHQGDRHLYQTIKTYNSLEKTASDLERIARQIDFVNLFGLAEEDTKANKFTWKKSLLSTNTGKTKTYELILGQKEKQPELFFKFYEIH